MARKILSFIPIILFSALSFSQAARACEKLKNEEFDYPRVDRYLSMKVGEKCVISFDLVNGYGSANFLNMEIYDLKSSDQLDVSIDKSTPKIYRFIIVAKSVGETEFEFGQTMTQSNFRSFQWRNHYHITVESGPAKAAALAETSSRGLTRDTRVEGIRLETVCRFALTPKQDKYDFTMGAKMYALIARGAKLSPEQCRTILVNGRL